MKIGIISDIHEDITRLNDAFTILKNENCEQIICLGDFVGYSVPYYGYLASRNAHKVIELLKKKCEFTLAGNHDLFAVRKIPKYKAGFPYPKNWYSLDFQTRQKISKNMVYLYEDNELPALLSQEEEKFVRQLPEFAVKQYENLIILFSHYAYPDFTGSLTGEPKTPADIKEHFECMKSKGCSLGISGHDHVEGIMLFTEKKVSKVPFNKTIKLTNNLTWLHGPSVANGTYANGVMVVDTEKKEIKAVPLKSKKHISPTWRKL